MSKRIIAKSQGAQEKLDPFYQWVQEIVNAVVALAYQKGATQREVHEAIGQLTGIGSARSASNYFPQNELLGIKEDK